MPVPLIPVVVAIVTALTATGCGSDTVLREAPEPTPEETPEPTVPDDPAINWPELNGCEWGEQSFPFLSGSQSSLYGICPLVLQDNEYGDQGEYATVCKDELDTFSQSLIQYAPQVFGPDLLLQMLSCDLPLTVFIEYKKRKVDAESPRFFELGEPLPQGYEEELKFWAVPDYAVNRIPDFEASGFPDGTDGTFDDVTGNACYTTQNQAALADCFPVGRLSAEFYQRYDFVAEDIIDSIRAPLIVSTRSSLARQGEATQPENELEIHAAETLNSSRELSVADLEYATSPSDPAPLPYTLSTSLNNASNKAQDAFMLARALCDVDENVEEVEVRCVRYLGGN